MMQSNQSLLLRETSIRSFIKGIGWRALASFTTIFLVLIVTQKMTLVLEVGALEIIAKLVLYYGYERVWNQIHWGRIPLSFTETKV